MGQPSSRTLPAKFEGFDGPVPSVENHTVRYPCCTGQISSKLDLIKGDYVARSYLFLLPQPSHFISRIEKAEERMAKNGISHLPFFFMQESQPKHLSLSNWLIWAILNQNMRSSFNHSDCKEKTMKPPCAPSSLHTSVWKGEASLFNRNEGAQNETIKMTRISKFHRHRCSYQPSCKNICRDWVRQILVIKDGFLKTAYTHIADLPHSRNIKNSSETWHFIDSYSSHYLPAKSAIAA